MSEYIPDAAEDSPASDPKQPPAVKPWVFSSLVRDHRLTAGAFRLWHLLFDMSRTSGRCWPGQRHLAGLLRCSEMSLKPWTEILVRCGYLWIERITESNRPPGCSGRKHGGFIYTCTIPSRDQLKILPLAPPRPAPKSRTLQCGTKSRTKLICTKTPPYSPQDGKSAAGLSAVRREETGKEHRMVNRADTKRELLRLSRRNSEAIRTLLSDPASYSDRQVSIPERLTRSSQDKLRKLERLAQSFKSSLDKKSNP